MAGSSLLALLDDIATVLDDVAVLSNVATRKTVLGVVSLARRLWPARQAPAA